MIECFSERGADITIAKKSLVQADARFYFIIKNKLNFTHLSQSLCNIITNGLKITMVYYKINLIITYI